MKVDFFFLTNQSDGPPTTLVSNRWGDRWQVSETHAPHECALVVSNLHKYF